MIAEQNVNYLEDYVFMKVVVEIKTKKHFHCCFSLKNFDAYDHYTSVGSFYKLLMTVYE